MDLLLTELSASLIEDMKDLEEQERRVSWNWVNWFVYLSFSLDINIR